MSSEETAKTQSEDEQKPASPSISLPKGGGAIRGMGEKFAANPVTGTGSMSVPIATSPGRSGFGPQLSLSYDSGAGNGPFGFGWNLSLPAITRKTDKGLPQYLDAVDSDVFILSGAEDLVPVLRPDGTKFNDDTSAPGYVIHRYRPRIEGLFARIERWTSLATGEIHWRSTTRDNITTVYGKNNNSRICDPANPPPFNPPRIFSWLICESYDDKGNAIVYEYAAENDINIDQSQANECNRLHTANRYLKRIKYGNLVSRLVEPNLAHAEWMFEVVFDYDEAHYEEVDLDFTRPAAEQHRFVRASASSGPSWAIRSDPFSVYRSGFEVRTYRRCHRILMFHHIPDLPSGEPSYEGLVRATEFDYADLDYTQPVTIQDELAHQGSTRFASFICAVTQSGYVRDDTQAMVVRDGVEYATYQKKSLPPLEFEYSKANIQDEVLEADMESLANLPVGLDGSLYQWVDLHGEGLPGILTEQADAWFYKRNLSPLPVTENSSDSVKARFAPVELVKSKPNLALTGGQAQIMDLAGNGQPDLVVLDGPLPGFYEHDAEEGWESFRPFISHLNRDTRDPNLKFIDLDGDGHADVLISEDNAFVWHPSLAEEGFGPAQRVAQAWDEEKGPRLVFADGSQSIYLADMCGDGLTDLVRIRNGEVCYWPNLGYGRFGAKVTMDNVPWFDNPDQFDQKRIRLADTNGSGTNDILYLHRDGVRIYFNLTGNRLSGARGLSQLPHVDNLSAVMTADLLGNGTACLVWSSPLPADARRPLRYIDLMGGAKPYLLVKSANNLGAETSIRYAPSTKFYLQDKLAGTPWITRLPFPVHVVERVETYDHISKNRFVTRYAYHHGYFDGKEREFRGFGMVEQWDTEEFAALSNSESFPTGDNVDAASHVPPIYTKTWFHTGAYIGRSRISRYFAGLLDAQDRGEYYREPAWRDDDEEANRRLLPDTILPDGLTLDEEREACRALKGSMLRQEVYAQDGTDEAEHPYTVTEQNFTIRTLQAKGSNRHGVFFSHARESISYHYERNPTDPRVGHALTLEVDDFGNVLKSAAIGYGRRLPHRNLSSEDQAQQAKVHITYTENSVTNPIDDGMTGDYRTPLPSEALTYELTSYTPTGEAGRFQPADFVKPHPDDPKRLAHIYDDEVPYEGTASNGKQRRLIEHLRTRYRPNDLGASQNDPQTLLPLGHLESTALPGESYKLAFTPGLLDQVYVRDGQELLPANPADLLGGGGADRSGCVDLDDNGHWWIPSGRSYFSTDLACSAATELAQARQHFFLPRRYRDPFGQDAVVNFDALDLLIVETCDALGNRVTVDANDYRVLQPRLISDSNRNRSEVAFDTLGMVAGTAVMGKTQPARVEGDTLDGFVADFVPAQLDQFMTGPRQPSANPKESEPTRIARDLLQGATTRIVYDLDRFRRLGEPPFAGTIARETHVSELQPGQESKIQVSFSYSDGFGREIQKKIQAEPGPGPQRGPDGRIIVAADGQPALTGFDVNPRWVGSGWTIFNNKGKPVRQYEPFFTDTHRFEFDVRIGVSPVLLYDPAERVIATLHPNHTYEKVVFDPWQQTTFDVNDTCAPRNEQTGDPSTDPDIGGYVAAYFKSQPSDWQTWYQHRIGESPGSPEQVAAQKAAAHADTPTTAHFDSLGRPFLTIARNRVVCPDHLLDGTEDVLETRVELDIEGNQRSVTDAKGRVVMRYDYDMLGTVIHQASMEAGARWMLNDISGKPIRTWDSRGFGHRLVYDALRRPAGHYVSGSGQPEQQIEKTIYGDTSGALSNPEQTNHRGKPYKVHDNAGLVVSESYDFKGNPLRSRRQLRQDYKKSADWQQNPELEREVFRSRIWYDALNRPVQLIAPHSDQANTKFDIIRPGYNEANLLERVEVWPQQHDEPQGLLDPAGAGLHAVTNIDYDAKGQRQRIDYGNGVTTRYGYDPATHRLTRLLTTRPAGGNGLAANIFSNPNTLQDLRYTYDPAGNITRIEDTALKTTFHSGEKIDPVARYTYDALYRLIEVEGREHIGQCAMPAEKTNTRDYPFAGHGPNANDAQALRHYTERYVYDQVGNFLNFIHKATGGNWQRDYQYEEASLLAGETGVSNRLTRTILHPDSDQPEVEPYHYDAHGNMVKMPHLPLMEWDFRDQLRASSRQVVNNGATPEITYYVYDAGGQRVRKVTENYAAAGSLPTKKNERIYLGGFEVYREWGGESCTLERLTLHVMDDKQRIALVETKTVDAAGNEGLGVVLSRYQLGNHLGSASLEVDGNGGLISYEEYHPYGTTAFQLHRGEVSGKRYRYTGMERDEETGLNYHSARYYALWLGRWCSCDPEGLVDGENTYQYVTSNPIIQIDPNGTAGRLPTTGMVADDPALGKFATQAIEKIVPKVLGPDFQGKSAPELMREFNHHVKGIEKSQGTLGSNRAKGTAINVGRETYKKVSAVVRRLAEKANINLKGRVFHHAIFPVHENPGASIDPLNLHLTEGNASVVGTGHNKATQALIKAENMGLKAFKSRAAQRGLIVIDADLLVGPARMVKNAVTTAVSRTNTVVGAVQKVAAPVARTAVRAARAAKVAAKVVSPALVVVSAYQMATAKTSLDRAQGYFDTGAGVIGCTGPVGEAFAAGYGGAQLVDNAIESVSEAALGVDLSPSGRIAENLTTIDRAITAQTVHLEAGQQLSQHTFGYRLASLLDP